MQVHKVYVYNFELGSVVGIMGKELPTENEGISFL